MLNGSAHENVKWKIEKYIINERRNNPIKPNSDDHKSIRLWGFEVKACFETFRSVLETAAL